MSIPQSAEGTVENYSQLVQFLEDGCKVHADWGIGTEHEKFGYDKKSFSPLPLREKHQFFPCYLVCEIRTVGRKLGRIEN